MFKLNFIYAAILFGTVVLIESCMAPAMQIRKDNLLSKEVYVVASGKKKIEAGRYYTVYRNEAAQMMSSGGHAGHGGHVHDSGTSQMVKKIVGMVRVAKVLDDNTASAEIVNGDVQDGDAVEE